MPTQPLQYRQIEDQYNQARSSGLFSEGSLQDFAKIGDYYQPGKYSSVADAGSLGLGLKKLSARFGDVVDWTGLPKVTEEALGWVFPKLGGTERVGREVGHDLPKAGASMAAGPAIGSVIGGIIGGVGGALATGGPGVVPGAAAGAETGAAAGSAITAFLFGIDAYEKSDSVKQAAFAAAIPSIAGKFSSMGVNAAMKYLPRLPGAQAVGVTGFKQVPGVIERTLPNGAKETYDIVTRGLEGAANKAAAFAGSQAGVMTGFAGIDLLKGEDMSNPDYWLAQAANGLVFSAPEAYHSFRPGYLPREEISKSLRVEKKPEVLTTEDIKRNSLLQALAQARTNYEKRSLLIDSGLDIADLDLKIQSSKIFDQKFQNDKVLADGEFFNRVSQEEVAKAAAPEAVKKWDTLKAKVEKARTEAQKEQAKTEFDAYKATISEKTHGSLLSELKLRDKQISKLRREREILEDQSSTPESVRLARLIHHGENELQLSGLNRRSFISSNKGTRTLSDYTAILKPRGWKKRDIASVFAAHVKEAYMRDPNSLSKENRDRFIKDGKFVSKLTKEPAVKAPDTTQAKPQAGKKENVQKGQTASAEEVKVPTRDDVPFDDSALLSMVEQNKNEDVQIVRDSFEAFEKPEDAVETAEQMKAEDAQKVAETRAELLAESEAGKESEVVGEFQPSESQLLLKSIQERAERLKQLKAKEEQLQQNIKEGKTSLSETIASPEFGMLGLNKSYEIVKELIGLSRDYLALGLNKIQIAIELRKFESSLSELEAQRIVNYAEQEHKKEADAKNFANNPKWMKTKTELFAEMQKMFRTGTFMDKVPSTRETLRDLMQTAKNVELQKEIGEMSRMFEAAVAVRTDATNIFAIPRRESDAFFGVSKLSGDTPADIVERVQKLTNLMLIGEDPDALKKFRPEGKSEFSMNEIEAWGVKVQDLKSRMELFDHGVEGAKDVTPEERAQVYALDALNDFMAYSGFSEIQRAVGEEAKKAAIKKFFDTSAATNYGPNTKGKPGNVLHLSNYEPPSQRSVMLNLHQVIQNWMKRKGEMMKDKEGKDLPIKQQDPRFKETRDRVEFDLRTKYPDLHKEDYGTWQKLADKIYKQELEKLEKGLSEKIPARERSNLSAAVASSSPEDLRTRVKSDLTGEFNATVKKFFTLKPDGPQGEKFVDPVTGKSQEISLERLAFLDTFEGFFRDETTYEEMHEEGILGESGLEKADVSEKQGVENEIDFLAEDLDSELTERVDYSSEKAKRLQDLNVDRFGASPIQVAKKIILRQKGENSPFELLKNALANHLFDEYGALRPKDQRDKFYDTFLIEGKFGEMPRVNEKAVEEFVLNTADKITQDIVQQRANKALFDRQQLEQERESFQKKPDGTFKKFRLLDMYMREIALHPGLKEAAPQILEGYKTGKLGPENILNLYRFAAAKPPPRTEASMKATDSKGRTVREAIQIALNRSQAEKAGVAKSLEAFMENVNEGLAEPLADQRLLRIEVLNYLYENPFEGNFVIRSGFNGEPMMDVWQKNGKFVEKYEAEATQEPETQIAALLKDFEVQDKQEDVVLPSAEIELPTNDPNYVPAKTGSGEDFPSAWKESRLGTPAIRLTGKAALNDKAIQTVREFQTAEANYKKALADLHMFEIVPPDPESANYSQRVAEREQAKIAVTEAKAKLDGISIDGKSFEDFFKENFIPGKPIPVELQGSLRLIAETFGKKWLASSSEASVNANKLSKAAKEAVLQYINYTGNDTAIQENLKRVAADMTAEAKLAQEEATKKKEYLASVEGFAPGIRGAHGDTDFLRLRSRLQEDKTSSFPHPTTPETSNFLQKFFFGAEALHGESPETKSLANKLQDEGFSGTVTPDYQPGDGWIGKNNLLDLQKAVELDCRVAYFAKESEIPFLKQLGLTIRRNGTEILAHTKELSGADALVRKLDHWAEELRNAGEDEKYISAMRPVVEALMRVNNSYEKVTFGSLKRGNQPGLTNVKGKTQMILSQVPESWHKMEKGGRAVASAFTLAHEMRHRLEWLQNQGHLGEEGVRVRSAMREWFKKQEPGHVRDMMDIMAQRILPKDWRKNEAIQEILKTEGRDFEEFEANFNALMDFSLVEHNVKDFGEGMRLLPAQVRQVWQWAMKKMQDMVFALKNVFKGEAKKDVEFLWSKMAQLRREANKAEEDLSRLQFFADLREDRIASSMGERLEMVGLGENPEAERFFRGAMEEVEDSNSPAGSLTKRTWLANKFRALIGRTEPYALFDPKFAKSSAVLMNDGHRAKTSTMNVGSIIVGSHASRTIEGDVKGGDKVFQAYQKDELIRTSGNMARNLKNLDENINFPAMLKQTDGTYKPNEELYKKDKKLWERIQRMSSEQRSVFFEMEARVFRATEAQQKESLLAIKDLSKSHLTQMLGAKFPEKHAMAEELSGKLYDVIEELSKGETAGEAVQKYLELQRQFDNDKIFLQQVKNTQEFLADYQKMEQFYKERPNYESLTRHTDHFIKMSKAGEPSFTIQSNDRREFMRQVKEAESNGWTSGRIVNKGDNEAMINLDSGLMDLLTQQGEKLKLMLERGEFGEPESSAYQEMALFLERENPIDTALRQVHAKELHMPGTKRDLTKGYEELDRLAQLFSYSARVNHHQSRQITKAKFLHELNSELLRNDRDARNDLRMRAENFFSPDSELGNFVTKWNAVWHLGFNLPSHLVELSQPYAMGIANLQAQGLTWLQGFNLMNRAQGYAKRFYDNYLKAKKRNPDKEFRLEDFVNTGDKALDDLLKGAIENHELKINSLDNLNEQMEAMADFSRMANGDKPEGKVSKILNAYAKHSMQLYGVFTRHNNIVGHIAGYLAAKEYRSNKGKPFSHEEAKQEALAFNRGTMLTGGRAGRQPLLFRNKTVGQTIMSLGSYTTGWLSTAFIHADMAFSKSRYPKLSAAERKGHKNAFINLLGSSLFFSGMMGMPFAGAMLKIFSDLSGEDLEAKAVETLYDLTKSPAIVDSIMRGGANALLDGAGIPIDMGAKMGLGGLFGFNPVSGYDPVSLLGPTASILKNFYNAVEPLKDGDYARAIQIGGPSVAKKFAEIVANENQFKSYDGRPLFDDKGKPSQWNELRYAMGFGDQKVRKQKEAIRLANSVDHYEKEKESKFLTELAGLVEKKSWLAQQKLVEHLQEQFAEDPAYASMNPVQQQLAYREAYNETVSRLATKVADLKLPIDPRIEANKRASKEMTKVISGLDVNLPDSSQLLRMSVQDFVAQKMGIAPPDRSRKTIMRAGLADQIQNQNPNWTMPQVKAGLIGL